MDSYEECFVLSLPTNGSYYKDYGNYGLFEELDENGEIEYNGTKMSVRQNGSLNIEVFHKGEDSYLEICMNNRGNDNYHCWIDNVKNGKTVSRTSNCVISNGMAEKLKATNTFRT